jgi:hypothetical protein
MHLLSGKGNASLLLSRPGAAPISCFGMIAAADRGVQGVIDDHLHMEGRTKVQDLNFYLEKYQREHSKQVAMVLLTVGGDLASDSAYANLVRELTEPGKERAALMVPEGYKDKRRAAAAGADGADPPNYEVYLVPPTIASKFPILSHSKRTEEFAVLREAAGPQSTDANTLYGVVTFIEAGLTHYTHASEVVRNHAANAAQAVLASISSDVSFDPEEAPAPGGGSSSSSSGGGGEKGKAGKEANAAKDVGSAYASASAQFSARGISGTQDDDDNDSAYLAQRAAMLEDSNDDAAESFDPAPARETTPAPAPASAPAPVVPAAPAPAPAPAPKAAAETAVLSAEVRELLAKAADHCARNGVKTFQQMKAREQKQRVKTMPFLFSGQPGHDLFKAEVVRREKEIKASKGR